MVLDFLYCIMYNIYIAILDHGSSRACAMGACATGNPGAVVIEYCKAAYGAAFFMSNLG